MMLRNGILAVGTSALRAAGLVPKPRMTHEDVVAALQHRHRQGLPMTTVWKEHVALYGNATRFFGSWRGACAAAGLESTPNSVESRRRCERRSAGANSRGSPWSHPVAMTGR